MPQYPTEPNKTIEVDPQATKADIRSLLESHLDELSDLALNHDQVRIDLKKPTVAASRPSNLPK